MSGKYTEAQKKATLKYLDKWAIIKVRVSEEKKEEYQEKAKRAGKSMNQFIIDLLENAE